MKIFVNILIAIGLIFGLVLVIGFFLPSEYACERSIEIDAPAEVVFDQVNDLEANRDWSPWEENDDTATFVYGPTTVGVGAWYEWEGDDVGQGRLTITTSERPRRIENDLDFPGQETARGVWTFEETEGGVRVTWSVTGDVGPNPIARYFALLAEGVIGENFERGLENLKRVSEAMPAAANDGG